MSKELCSLILLRQDSLDSHQSPFSNHPFKPFAPGQTGIILDQCHACFMGIYTMDYFKIIII